MAKLHALCYNYVGGDAMNTLTPLRYPGGKTKLFKKVSDIIIQNNLQGCTYVEPFVGGAGLAIKLLDKNIVNNLIINDFDYHIYCFWYCVLYRTNELINLIDITPITLEERLIQKSIYNNPENYNEIDIAFSTLYLNRTNRSGVLKAGPIGGQKQNGNYLIDCRFNKDKIIKKIVYISNYKDNIEVYNLDAIDFIEILNYRQEQLFINFDPPYYNKGAELYTNFFNDNDHIRLKYAIDNVRHPWITTYDNCDFIYNLYREYRNEMISLTYTAGTVKKGKELLFYSNRLRSPK